MAFERKIETEIVFHLQLSGRMVASLYVIVDRRTRCDGRTLVSSHLRRPVRMSQVAFPDFFLTTARDVEFFFL